MGARNAAQKGQEKSSQALLHFSSQAISVGSKPFCPITFLYEYSCFIKPRHKSRELPLCHWVFNWRLPHVYMFTLSNSVSPLFICLLSEIFGKPQRAGRFLCSNNALSLPPPPSHSFSYRYPPHHLHRWLLIHTEQPYQQPALWGLIFFLKYSSRCFHQHYFLQKANSDARCSDSGVLVFPTS